MANNIKSEIISLLDDRNIAPERALEEALVLELFRRGEISRGVAARVLDMDLVDFLHLASERGIGVIDL